MSLKFTHHAMKRAAQRCLLLDDLNFIEEYGQEFHKAGVVFYYLRECDLPQHEQVRSRRRRLVGSALVMADDGQTVITTWRNRRNGLRHIKRKSDHKGGSNRDIGWLTR